MFVQRQHCLFPDILLAEVNQIVIKELSMTVHYKRNLCETIQEYFSLS